jgi:fused signal recognition particle receptor
MALFWKRKEQPPEFVTAPPSGEQAEDFVDEPPPAEPQSQVAADDVVPTAHPTQRLEQTPAKAGFFGKMRAALADKIQKTRDDIVGQIREAVKAAGKVDENLLEKIEEILIKADVGAETTMRIVEEMREFEARGASGNELLESFKSQLHRIVGHGERNLNPVGRKPFVVLVVGVNGTGKTTTIGKLGAEFQGAGRKTMLVAGDTFRAAAIEQLQIWSKRSEAAFFNKEMGSDSAGVAYDAIHKARMEGYEVVLIDTAGRLHTKSNLMEELKKIVRVIEKVMPGAPHETLLVLDATTGQNAIQQARVFTESIPITGIVMTKLDGTAKGGVLIGIRNLFDIPVVKIGIGESIEDLRDFNAGEFVEALFAE